MKNTSKQKNILRQFLHSCFCLGLAFAFVLNSFLPAFTISKSGNNSFNNLTYDDLSTIAYAYKNVLNNDSPSNKELLNIAEELTLTGHEINIKNARTFLSDKVRKSPNTKAQLIKIAFKNKFNTDIPDGKALSLTNTLLAENNDYPGIYETIENTGSNDENSFLCDVTNLELLDFYMASPQIKASLKNPFSSVTWSTLSSKQTLLSELDHTVQGNKLAWNLLGYPTSFGLTYNRDGKFVNVTSSPGATSNLIGISSDAAKINNELVLGGFLPYARFNPSGNEYYSVGADPKGGTNKPYLYGFDISANDGGAKRFKDTFDNHYPGFSQGLDVTPNGLVLLGVEKGNLTAAWKEPNKVPSSINNISQLIEFTRDYTNHFEVDEGTGSNNILAIASYVLPDTYKYTDILSTLTKTNPTNQFGFTLFSLDQNQDSQAGLSIASRTDLWDKDLDNLLGHKNVSLGGIKINNNKLFISYVVNKGVDFKKFYEINFPKYLQEGKSWIDQNTGLPPNAFKFEDGLYDTRLAVFNIVYENNKLQLQKYTDISTVFDNPGCSGNSYGVSGPIEIKDKIFVADKTYAPVIRAFKFDSNSILKITPANSPYVIRLNNPRIAKALFDSKYKPLSTDFTFSTSISDIAIDPASKILFVSLPYIENSIQDPASIHINGFLGSFYLTDLKERCSKIASSESCSDALQEDDKGEYEKDLAEDETASKEDKAGRKKELRYLSITDGVLTPTIAIGIKINNLTNFDQSEFRSYFADVDTAKSPKSPDDAWVATSARGVNFATAFLLNTNPPGDYYYPLLLKKTVQVKEQFNILSRSGINTYGKSIALSGDGKTLNAITNDGSIKSGAPGDLAIAPFQTVPSSFSPVTACSLPDSPSGVAFLESKSDGLHEANSLVVYLNNNQTPVRLQNIHGNVEEHSLVIPLREFTNIPLIIDETPPEKPFPIKFKINQMKISGAKTKDGNIAVSYFSHNSLKSKVIYSYLDKILDKVLPSLEASGDSLDSFLNLFFKTAQGFTLFTVPDEDSLRSGKTETTYKNFYLDNLESGAPQLVSTDGKGQKVIADVEFIKDPDSNDLYLAFSTYNIIKADPLKITTQKDPNKDKSKLGSKSDKDDLTVPGIITKDLLLSLNAATVKTGKDAQAAAKEEINIWENQAKEGYGYNGILNGLVPKDTWTGSGTTQDPFAAKISGKGNISVGDGVFNSIRKSNSYTLEWVGKIDSFPAPLFFRGTDQGLFIDKDGNINVISQNNDVKNTYVKVNQNEWTQILVTKSADDFVKLYRNGKLAWSKVTSPVIDRAVSAQIGSGPAELAKQFNGKVLAVNFYSNALSDQDVYDNNYLTNLSIYTEKSKVDTLLKQSISGANCGIQINTKSGDLLV